MNVLHKTLDELHKTMNVLPKTMNVLPKTMNVLPKTMSILHKTMTFSTITLCSRNRFINEPADPSFILAELISVHLYKKYLKYIILIHLVNNNLNFKHHD